MYLLNYFEIKELLCNKISNYYYYYFRLVERVIFKKVVQNGLSSDFVKLGSEILNLFLAEKCSFR